MSTRHTVKSSQMNTQQSHQMPKTKRPVKTVLNAEVVITTNEQPGECQKITKNKEKKKKTEGLEMTIKLLEQRTNRPSSVRSTCHKLVQQNGKLVTRF